MRGVSVSFSSSFKALHVAARPRGVGAQHASSSRSDVSRRVSFSLNEGRERLVDDSNQVLLHVFDLIDALSFAQGVICGVVSYSCFQ